MIGKERVATNIRALRKAHGESQAELGAVLGVQNNTISVYENGNHEPGIDAILAIADHYMVSVDELLKHDFGDMERIRCDDNNMLNNNLEKLFPIIKPTGIFDGSMDRAIRIHTAMYERARENDYSCFYNIESCLRHYSKAYESELNRVEAAANYLSLYYLFKVLIGFCKIITNYKSLSKQLEKMDIKIYRQIKNLQDHPEYSDEIEECIGLFDEALVEKMQEDVSSSSLSNLLYYYVALEFFSGSVDNGRDRKTNMTTGLEMLKSYIFIGNTYAMRFWKIMFMKE